MVCTLISQGREGGKREIGGCEIPPLSLKYGPYLALPDGPEPPVLRLAPETERSGPLPANPGTA